MTHATPPTAPAMPAERPDQGGIGLEVTSLVLGILGFCIPLVGLVAIILGVIALARGRTRGKGLAIGGIVTGALGMLMSVALVIGMLLPALASARHNARMAKGASQVQQLVMEMRVRGIEDPSLLTSTDPNLQARLKSDPTLWVSPSDVGGSGTSYVHVLPEPGAKIEDTSMVLAENPSRHDGRDLNVAFGDGHSERLPRDQVIRRLKDAGPRVFHTDGTPWQAKP